MKLYQRNDFLHFGWRLLLLFIAVCLTVPCLIMLYYQIVNISDFSMKFFVVSIINFVAYVWFFALNKSKDKAVKALSCLQYGFIVGALGFLFGYFAPIYLSKSNIGPLTGFFISGPLGFILGSTGRILYVLREDGRP